MASCVSLHDFLVFRCFSNDDTQTTNGGELFLFSVESKKARSFFLFLFLSRFDGRKRIIYEYATFIFRFLHGRLEKSGWTEGWMGWHDGSFDQVWR